MAPDGGNRCARCGVTHAGEPGALCPACLLRIGLEQGRTTVDSASSTTPHAAWTDDRAGGPMPERIGDWRPIRPLGEGGMGVVYLVEDLGPLDRKGALKRVKHGLDSRAVLERFDQERRVLSRMDHPGIARAIDAGAAADGTPYFVMEYVDGIPITEYCDKQRLNMRERLRLFSKLCDAVDHAHRRGILHRDLKPSNILVVDGPNGPQPKVIDFGVARAVAQHRLEWSVFTEFGRLIGTPEYMSPEQADLENDDLDTRSDVYCLGVILYELLVGKTPHDPASLRDQGLQALLKTIREATFPTPSSRLSTLGDEAGAIAERRGSDPERLRRGIAGELDWIVMRATERDRERRYGSPNELAQDIQRFLNNEPIFAGPPGAGYRLRKFVRRHRIGVTVVALTAIVLVGVAARERVQSTRIAAERDRAALEAETARQVSEFLTDLFAVSDPSEARGNSITAREILDQGARRIRGELREQPEIQARLMLTMGTVYQSLGLYESAVPLLEEARKTLSRVLDEEHPTTLLATNKLANLYVDQGRYDEAEPLLLQTLETQRRVLGEEHAQTLRSVGDLGVLYGEQGRYDEAEPLLLQTLEKQRRVLGEVHLETMSTVSNLAHLYYKKGQYEKVEPLFLQQLETTRRELGEDHPATLSAVNNLAVLLSALGRNTEAEPFYLRSLEGRRRVLGEEHPQTLNSRNNLAEVYARLGRYDEAEPLFRRSLDACRRVLGDSHAYTMNAVRGLSGLYKKQGRYEDAEPLDREALESSRRVLGEEHPTTLSSMSNLALLLDFQGRHDEAEPLYRKALETKSRLLGEEHPSTLISMNNLAGHYRDRGRYAEAESLYQETLEAKRRLLGEEHPSTLRSMNGLAELHHRQGRYGEAESLYLRTLDARRRVLGEEHPASNDCRRDLAALMAVRGLRDDAIGWLREALDHGFSDRSVTEDPDFASLHGDPAFEAIVAEFEKRNRRK